VFSGSRGAGSNPSTAGSASGGNGAANQLNLRNVGITRTLVLMDGLRIPPTLFNGAVDVDLVPQMLVQRVDVVTGGVSAVYGSDAVSGVVNYVINKNFNGLRVEGSGGISEYGDARQMEIGGAYGTKIGDNGHFEASYQFRDSGGILRRSDRPWMNLVGVGGNGTTVPYNLYTNVRQTQFPAGGRIISGAGSLNGQVFSSNGVLSPFVNGTTIPGTTAFQVGGDGGTWDSSLLQPYRAHQLFARYDHTLSDSLKAHVQLSGNFKTNELYAEYARIDGATIRADNPFLSQTIRNQLTPGSTFVYRQTLSEGRDTRQYTVSNSGQWVANAGVEGAVGGFDWALDYVHGQTLLRTRVSNNLNQQRLAAALDAVDVGGGVIKCYAATQSATAAAYADCIPLNPFGPTAASTSNNAYDYIFGTTNYRALTKMDDISGNISGSPFSTWAGDVNVAVAAEWRRLSFKAKSDATAADFTTCTGLRYNCTGSPQTQYFITLPNQFRVSQTVAEVAGEVNVPLLKDSAIGSFNVNGAVRYTRYNTSGNYTTWKLGADWELTDTLRFRGTISRDIRAPTLYELYSEPFFVNVTATDRFPGSTAGNPVVPSINISNPNLKAEVAKTITGGVVWKPIPQLSIALDGYQIQIDDAIQQINGGDDVVQAACYASAPTYDSPFCALQTRKDGIFSTTSPITAVYSKLFNIAQTKTWGADLEVNFNSSLFGRAFNARVLAAYQPHLWFRQPGINPRDQAGAAFGPTGFAATPTVRLTGFVRFKPTDRLTVDIMQRWRNAMKISNDGVWAPGANRMGPFATTNLNLTWAVDGGYEFFVNVQNVFDATPPIGGFTGNGNRAGLRDGYAVGDDVRGRFWTAGFKIKM
jgi:outer membrane receptor protein involved in Fe transport